MKQRTWCITGNATDDAMELAGSLLAAGDRVALLSEDVSRYAMLVNEFADRALVVEADLSDLDSCVDATTTILESWDEVEVVRVIPSPGGPLRMDVTTVASTWPDADIGVLSSGAPMCR